VISNPQLILTSISGLPILRPGDDLGTLILEGLRRGGINLLDGDILAIASKAISKVEGRHVHLDQIRPSPEAEELGERTQKDPRLVELILGESRALLRARPGLLIVEHRLGFVCANAGIDSSNVNDVARSGEQTVLLLPEDPDRSARELVERVESDMGVQVGVLIIDSHGRAWREGAVGVAIGVAGMPALVDLRGVPDLFGRPLQSTRVGLADELAGAASVLMGQAAEGLPVVHVRGMPYEMEEGGIEDLLRPKEKDLFR
jgi:coenzyme F420-0:L-glutamate ligase/coenzyme F420-1:gamma-L-glutamate ligase